MNKLWMFILVGMFFSCVEDEPVVRSSEATIRSRFIPADSVSRLQAIRNVNRNDQNQINEELDRLDSLENAGDPEDFTPLRQAYQLRLDSLEEASSELSTLISRLSGGSIQLDYLTAIGSSDTITYGNPQEIYGLPLNSNEGASTFQMGYGTYNATATFIYNTETLFEENRVRFRGTEVTLAGHNFDSVTFQCDTVICNTDEILFTFYF